MSGKRFWIAALFVVVTMLAASAAAQDEKNEIGGIIGRTFVSDQGIKGATYFDPIIHFGKGLSFEAEYARRFLVTPIYAISAEVPFMYDHNMKLNAGQYGFAVVPTSLQLLLLLLRQRA